MKKKYILFAAVLAFAGCKKSDISLFDENPEVRLNKSVTQVKTELTGAPNGWIATLPTNAGGGYAFHMTFDANENVKMYADLTTASSTTSATSTYRVKAVQGPELIFDTFNYISMLADPVPATFNGAAGSGYKSDIEFIYNRSTADSIFFTGKKYGQPMIMVKASAAQKASYDAAGYKTAIDKFKDFFTVNRFPYIEIGTGSTALKAGLTFDFTDVMATGKRLAFTGLLGDGSVASTTAKFGLTIYGAGIPAGLVYQNITFVRIAWKDATTLAVYDSTGKEYIIKNNAAPVVPFATLFKYNGTYNGIFISGQTLPVGVTSGFTAIFNGMVTRFNGTSRTITSTEFKLINSTTAKLEIWYMSGTSAFLADASFNYVISGDQITLSNYVPSISNSNWTTRITEIGAFKDFFINNTFKLDWAISSNASVAPLGGMYLSTNTSSFMYGVPRKN